LIKSAIENVEGGRGCVGGLTVVFEVEEEEVVEEVSGI
jgi:hypothetical protein